MIIAIDGPAGSGKSSTAREIARRLDALYIDTGAMYRAVALHFLENDLPITADAAESASSDLKIGLEPGADGVRVFLGDRDVSDLIRSEEISTMSSRVSRIPEIRSMLVDQQRRIAQEADSVDRDVVMEGRDIGTVVFPNARYKFFLTADARVRAERRAEQLRDRGEDVDVDVLRSDIVARDKSDAGRDVSPLRKADDAVEVDTTAVSFEDQVEFILRAIKGNA